VELNRQRASARLECITLDREQRAILTGKFHDSFVYNRRADTWDFTLLSQDRNKAWTQFAHYRVARVTAPAGGQGAAPAPIARIDRAIAVPLEIPPAVRQRPLFTDLEYGDTGTVVGVAADLDGDGHPELIIRSAESLCGNSACRWAIVDGATLRGIATVNAASIYIEATNHEFPVVHGITSLSAVSAEWTTYAYTRGAYAEVAHRTFAGRSLDSLTRALVALPPP